MTPEREKELLSKICQLQRRDAGPPQFYRHVRDATYLMSGAAGASRMGLSGKWDMDFWFMFYVTGLACCVLIYCYGAFTDKG